MFVGHAQTKALGGEGIHKIMGPYEEVIAKPRPHFGNCVCLFVCVWMWGLKFRFISDEISQLFFYTFFGFLSLWGAILLLFFSFRLNFNFCLTRWYYV